MALQVKRRSTHRRNFASALPTGIPRLENRFPGQGRGFWEDSQPSRKVRRWPQGTEEQSSSCERQKEDADTHGPEVPFRLWGLLVPENQGRGSGVAISIRTHVIGGPPRWRADDNGGPAWSDTV